jgi:hypothetical protein
MKAAVAVLVTLLFGVTAADAGWVPTKKLPKPIDTPIVRPKIKETHKEQNRQKHPPSHRSAVAMADTATA